MQRRLDGFSVLELIGFGGSGEVWRARPDDGGADVALKWLITDGLDPDPAEVSAVRDFQHPHAARLLDIRQSGSGLVLVQEFIAGVSLATLLTQRDRLSSAEVVTVLTPVAEALEAAHDAGHLHGTLAPTEVLITADGRPMVTGIGMWQCLGGAAGTSGASARCEYVDPCVARGGRPTSASDVFGIAAIGFHALTGRAPWVASTGAQTWELAADGVGVDLNLLRTGSRTPLAEVIARGLAEQPGSRGSAQEFARDVREAIEPEPLHLAGPYLWPDLPPTPEQDRAESVAQGLDPGRVDIAGEVRRGGSAVRHAVAAPYSGLRLRGPGSPSRAPGAGWQPLSRMRATSRIVPRRTVVTACICLAVAGLIVFCLGGNAVQPTPAQAAAPIGVASEPVGPNEDTAQPSGSGIDETLVPGSTYEWTALLSVLYQRRALAFGTGNLRLLDQVFSAESPLLLADRRELTRLVSAGEVLRGFAPEVLETLHVQIEDDRAVLQITDAFADYQSVPAIDIHGPAVAEHPGRGPTSVSMTLVLTEPGWRIQSAQRHD